MKALVKIYAGIKRKEQARSLQNSLHSVLKWGHDWQMLFNLSKCSKKFFM